MSLGWKKEILKDACDIFTDGNWIESKDQSPEGIRLVQTGNIGFGYFKDKTDKARFISEETFGRLKCTEILPKDLLVSRLPDPVGKSCIIPDIQSKMITGVDCTIIRTKDYLMPEFLLNYQMSNQYLSDVNSKVTGTTRSRISRKNLGMVEIPIPPLEEQKQIVALLDKTFAAIDQAKANVEKNLQNAKELFQSKLNDIFTQKGEGWEEKKLSDPSVCQTIFAGGDAPKANFSKERTEKYNIPIFANAVKNNGLYGFSDHYRVSEPSITVAARGSGTGHTEIRYESFLPIVRLIVLIPNTEMINLEYLKYSIQNLDILRSGSAIPQLTVPMIKEYSISRPPLIEQEKIVDLLDALSDEIKKNKATLLQKITALEELKKSILQKAFAGELTTGT